MSEGNRGAGGAEGLGLIPLYFAHHWELREGAWPAEF